MATESQFKILKVLRASAGILSGVAGILLLSSELVGPDPIRITTGSHQYFQLVAHPPQHALLFGISGIAVGALLIFLPALRRRSGR